MKSHGKSKAVLTAVIFEVNLLQSSRFGEALEKTKETLDRKNFYYFNPEFDKQMVAAPAAAAGGRKITGNLLK